MEGMQSTRGPQDPASPPETVARGMMGRSSYVGLSISSRSGSLDRSNMPPPPLLSYVPPKKCLCCEMTAPTDAGGAEKSVRAKADRSREKQTDDVGPAAAQAFADAQSRAEESEKRETGRASGFQDPCAARRLSAALTAEAVYTSLRPSTGEGVPLMAEASYSLEEFQKDNPSMDDTPLPVRSSSCPTSYATSSFETGGAGVTALQRKGENTAPGEREKRTSEGVGSRPLAGAQRTTSSTCEWTAPFIEALILQLRRRELRGSHQAARRTAEVLRRLVDVYPWQTTHELIEVVKHVGRRLIRASPMEFLVANVLRRVLCIIRREHYKHVELQRHRQQQQAAERAQKSRDASSLHSNPGSVSEATREGSRKAESPSETALCRSCGCVSSSASVSLGRGEGNRREGEEREQHPLRPGASGEHLLFSRERPALHRTTAGTLHVARWASQRAAPSMAMYFDPYASPGADDCPPISASVKQSIFEGISELVAEVDSAWEEGDDVRTACFLNGDCILTYGYSLAVERLLKAIHRKNQEAGEHGAGSRRTKKKRVRCNFQVIVLGGDPEQGGKKMAQCLVACGIKTAYVADGALFAVMNKVDKVVLGTRAVLSSGSAVTISGARYVAEAAKTFSKPVIVVAPLFKLTHLPVYDHHSRNELLPPALLLPDSAEMENVSVRIPLYDYIPDKLLTVFITEIGPIDPSYLYTLSKQRYHIDDLDLCTLD
ncbi:UNVERIFIED_CONTAM: eukaryotic translation initiation factor 2B, putative [Hammondia hammondi]|eukprot:XP_008883612.1 eukaryotic translation initiation factor 2B, putative [Hammondia hammondi]